MSKKDAADTSSARSGQAAATTEEYHPARSTCSNRHLP